MAVSGTSTGESGRVLAGFQFPRREEELYKLLGFGPGTHGRKDCQFKAKLSHLLLEMSQGTISHAVQTGIWNCRISSVRRGVVRERRMQNAKKRGRRANTVRCLLRCSQRPRGIACDCNSQSASFASRFARYPVEGQDIFGMHLLLLPARSCKGRKQAVKNLLTGSH